MRISCTILALACCLSLKAQTPFLMNGVRFNPWASLYRPLSFGVPVAGHGSWQLYPYSGFSAGTGFFNGNSVSAISAPLGLELFHPVSDRVTAFAGVSVAPTLYSFSRNFYNANGQPGLGDPNAYKFGVNPRLEMGLMYTNEEHTFSISGSFGVERGSNYLPYLPAQRQTGSKR